MVSHTFIITANGNYYTERTGNRLDKTFETFFFGLAYGTYIRWPVPGAEISADLAPPDRQGQYESHRSSGYFRGCFRFPLLPLLRRRPSFRDAAYYFFTLQRRVGDIQGAVAGVIFRDIGVTVITGTDDIEVARLVPRGEPARAGPVAVPALIDD